MARFLLPFSVAAAASGCSLKGRGAAYSSSSPSLSPSPPSFLCLNGRLIFPSERDGDDDRQGQGGDDDPRPLLSLAAVGFDLGDRG